MGIFDVYFNELNELSFYCFNICESIPCASNCLNCPVTIRRKKITHILNDLVCSDESFLDESF